MYNTKLKPKINRYSRKLSTQVQLHYDALPLSCQDKKRRHKTKVREGDSWFVEEHMTVRDKKNNSKKIFKKKGDVQCKYSTLDNRQSDTNEG